ncbi:hypothetical protein ACFORO_42685 [Amycolatopsis halotolerans]|uniref:Uncharacterized protein n=1 Tax=Amycolatopsis halotolerans TaxID=330083 RepID=A0ABV7QUI5_9PSEU
MDSETYEYRVMHRSPTTRATNEDPPGSWVQFKPRSGGSTGVYPTLSGAQRGKRYVETDYWYQGHDVKIQRRPVSPWADM